jgi:hypothetical protein
MAKVNYQIVDAVIDADLENNYTSGMFLFDDVKTAAGYL